jgi:hypothetical protein
MGPYPDPDMMDRHRMMGEHGMMGGHGMYSMTHWLPAGLVLLLVLLLGISWLVMLWLSYQKHTPVMRYSAQPQDAYHPYEQGYMSRQPLTETYETYEEGERDYPYAQPHQEGSHGLMELEYPQQELPWQQ